MNPAAGLETLQEPGPSTVSVDIGGTWIRVSGPKVTKKLRSPSKTNYPHDDPAALFQHLADFLCEAAPRNGRVCISIGAATDDTTEHILGSGPLWGDWQPPISLTGLLRKNRPDVSWHMFNDVSCGLAHFLHRQVGSPRGYIAYLTISTGIAMKTANTELMNITVAENGLQGEVGHIQASLPRGLRDLLGLVCDCGQTGHIAAVCSGAAIPRVAANLGICHYTDQWFKHGVASGDRQAKSLLEAVTYPIAQLLRLLFATQPSLSMVGIGGGVVESIGPPYREALLSHLEASRDYSSPDARFYGPRIVTENSSEISPLAGAILLAEGYLTTTKAYEKTIAK